MRRFYDFTLALRFNNKHMVAMYQHLTRATYKGIG